VAVLSTVDIVGGVRDAWAGMLDKMRTAVFEPSGRKTLDMRINIDTSAYLLNRTPNGLRRAIANRPDLAPKVMANGRPYYTVHDLERLRAALNWHPHKAAGERPGVIAVQNFKGGVGKSTVSCHLAHYFGLRGYRVLVIDCDSQASTTGIFDINPDLDLDPEKSVAHFMRPAHSRLSGGVASLLPVMHDTAWPTIKIVPANLSLQDVEYELTKESTSAEGFINAITRLKRGIDAVADDFDVVILDPPPALGFMALNAMVAATGMIVPAPAKQLDFASTVQFLTMLESNLDVLAAGGVRIEYDFLRILCSNHESSRHADQVMWQVMQDCSGTRLLPTPLLHSETIKGAANIGRTVYELDGPVGSPAAYRNCRQNLDTVFGEIELAVRKTWPSHTRDLSRKGLTTEIAA
jgi:chromosome partitioning protein